jgi:glycosyltransferase involved in cell wall biosynthesis
MPRSAPEQSIFVFVCSRGFSAEMRRTLESLCNQQVADGWIFGGIHIVWNLPRAESIEQDKLLEEWREHFRGVTPGIASSYEEEPGIPHARNNALRVAHHIGADWIAFIDDDCIASKNWLHKLTEYASDESVNVVAGGWIINATRNPSPWLPDGVFGRKHYQVEGADTKEFDQLMTAYTRNVAFELNFLDKLPAQERKFDESATGTGGSDALFFHALTKAGAYCIYGSEAMVTELYDGDRVSLGWHFLRRIRNTQQRIIRSRTTGEEVVGITRGLKSLLGLFVRLPFSFVILPFAPVSRRVKKWIGSTILRTAPFVAIFLLAIGIQYEEYKQRFSKRPPNR